MAKSGFDVTIFEAFHKPIYPLNTVVIDVGDISTRTTTVIKAMNAGKYMAEYMLKETK